MTVSVNGAELFYSTRGSGPTCLVPSAIGTKPYERMRPPRLSDQLRLVYVDLRGGGRSTGNPGDLTFDVLADDLEAVRVDLGAERVAILGHSVLGVLAIEYGRRCRSSVSHVITVGTPPRGDMARLSADASALCGHPVSAGSDKPEFRSRGQLPQLPDQASTVSIRRGFPRHDEYRFPLWIH